MKCKECKGSGFYVGLTSREPCKACGGDGIARLKLGSNLEITGIETHYDARPAIKFDGEFVGEVINFSMPPEITITFS